MILYLSIALFFASFIASLFGIGGGVLYTPFQLWFGVPFNNASVTSFILIMATSLSATLIFRRSKRVDWYFGIILEVPTMAGAFLGGIIAHYFSSHLLTIVLIVLLVVTAWSMIKSFNFKGTFCVVEGVVESFWYLKRKWEGSDYSIDMRYMIPIMFVTGVLISVAGISGGVLQIPIMVLLFRTPMSVAVGTSAFMVGLTATAGIVGHLMVESVNWKSALLLLIPVFIGAQIGSRVSVAVKASKLKWLYGWFLLLVAVITFLRVWNIV